LDFYDSGQRALFFVRPNIEPGQETEIRLKSVKLTNLLKPLVEDLGYEFVGLEHGNNPKNPVLVVYIDKQDGIAVEDCERVSREVAALLDVEDPIPGRYNLEISSPGLDRPLFTLEQFEQFAGEVARISLYAPQEGRRKFKGKILGTEGDQVKLALDESEVMLELGNVAKARLVPDYDNLFSKREAR
jgi:ribosome maturation factor RimP